MKTLFTSLILSLSLFAQQPPLRRPVVTLTSTATDTYVGTAVNATTAAPALTALTPGQELVFKANTANTDAASLNVDGLGAVTIVKLSGAVNTALATDDIRVDQWVTVMYDGTNFQMKSQLGNAAAAGGGGVAMLVGYGNATAQSSGNTTYYSFSNIVPGSVPDNVQLPVRAITLSNLRLVTSLVQGAADNVCTIWKAAAGAAYSGFTPAQVGNITLTITASTGPSVYTSTGTGSVSAGDRIYMKCVNGAAVGGAMRNYSIEIQ